MRLAPFLEAQDFDEMFGRFFGQPGPAQQRRTGFEVPTDVFHAEDALVIRLDLPGVDPDGIDVTVQDNALLINGSRTFPFELDQVRFVRRGAFYGEFTQRVVLGKGLKVDEIAARYDSGVLELRIPYAEEVQPRKISIEVASDKRELTE